MTLAGRARSFNPTAIYSFYRGVSLKIPGLPHISIGLLKIHGTVYFLLQADFKFNQCESRSGFQVRLEKTWKPGWLALAGDAGFVCATGAAVLGASELLPLQPARALEFNTAKRVCNIGGAVELESPHSSFRNVFLTDFHLQIAAGRTSGVALENGGEILRT